MSNQPQNRASNIQFKSPQSAVRIMQLVVLALMLGVMVFTGLVVFLNSLPLAGPKRGIPVALPYFGIIGAIVNIVLRLVVPGFVTASIIKAAAQQNAERDITKLELYPAYFVGLIVGAALLEGAAFFNIVIALMTSQSWSFVVVGVLLVMMAATFPTMERVDNWAEEELRQLRLDPPKLN